MKMLYIFIVLFQIYGIFGQGIYFDDEEPLPQEKVPQPVLENSENLDNTENIENPINFENADNSVIFENPENLKNSENSENSENVEPSAYEGETIEPVKNNDNYLELFGIDFGDDDDDDDDDNGKETINAIEKLLQGIFSTEDSD